MTFAARAHFGSGLGIQNPIGSMYPRDIEASGNGVAALLVGQNGQIVYVGNDSYGAEAWSLPTGSGVGDPYYVKFTLVSGATWDSGPVAGTVYSLSTTRSLTWTASPSATKTAQVLVQIYSDAAGTLEVTRGTAYAYSQSTAAATGVQPLGSMALEGNTPSSNNRVASLTLNADGTVSYLNQMADPVYSTVPTNWYLPTTAAVGAGYRVRFTLQSGNAWTAGLTSGTLYALSAARTVSWTLVPTASVNATVLVEIVSSSNTTVLGSGTLYINLQSDY